MKILSPSRRRRVPSGLPDLGALECTSAPYFDKAGAIATRLRQIAAKTRNDHLRPFYSMRAVADHFHVPPATVSRVYHWLRAEGLLRTLWGSKTLLEPAKTSGSGECRCIGIPVSLARFTASAEYRTSILLLQLEMWNHDVDEHLLFFKEHEDEVVSLCTRSHHPHIDTVVWLFPSVSCRQTLLRLRDVGFRVFCLTDRPMGGVPDCHAISDRSSVRMIIRRQILKIL
jgi:DNA-binding transcriptional regulator YhcF (GntR family)